MTLDVIDLTTTVCSREVILRPKAADKTTTLEMIEGLRPTTSGTVVFDGIKTMSFPIWFRQRIGIQLQFSALFLGQF